jgi:hypothetical protein
LRVAALALALLLPLPSFAQQRDEGERAFEKC